MANVCSFELERWVGMCGLGLLFLVSFLFLYSTSNIPSSWKGYTGITKHSRLKDATYSFTQPIYFDWLHLRDPPSIGSLLYLDESDHLQRSLCNNVETNGTVVQGTCLYDRICHIVGYQPTIYLLTNLRFIGHCFNSISIYYCLTTDVLVSENVTHLVFEVWNTPWDEVTVYTCRVHESRIVDADRTQPKKMHVSPFNPPSNMNYRFSTDLASFPDILSVTIEVSDTRGIVNVVSMNIRRGNVRFLRVWGTLWNKLVIHWHAAVLYCKNHRVYGHSR